MADLRIVLQLPNEDQPMDIDDDFEQDDSDQGNDVQGQRSFSTIGSGIMAFNETPSPLDVTSPEELLTPLARLKTFAISENVFNRRMIAHDACNVLESVIGDEADFDCAVRCYISLSEDLEPSVRVELMEQISDITEHFGNKVLDSAVIPILLRYLTDVNNQVRKTCHCVLVDITKREFLDVSKFEKEIMPLLKDLSSRKQAPDEHRTEVIALICQICDSFGSSFAERYFLPIFLESCKDEGVFHVRKVCAGNFSSFCDILDENLISKDLLPRFIELCRDNVWGVRKSCAESFPDFAKHISEDTRINVLSPIFSTLLSDQSRWVRVAAFESLGPFISTFADSNTVGKNLTQTNSEDNEQTSAKDDVVSDFDSFLYWRDPIPPVKFDEDFEDLTVFDENNKEEIYSQVYVNSSTSETTQRSEINDNANENEAPDGMKEQNEDDVYSPTKESILKSVEFSADKENIPVNFNVTIDETGSGVENGDHSDGIPEYDDLSHVPDISLGEGKKDVSGEAGTDLDAEVSIADDSKKTNRTRSNGISESEDSNHDPATLENHEEVITTDLDDEEGESNLAAGDSLDLQPEKQEEESEGVKNDENQDGSDSDDEFFDENEPKNWQSPNLLSYPEFFDMDGSSRGEIDYRIFSSNLSDVSYARADRIHDPFDILPVQSPSPKPSFKQNVVPQQLLDNFLSMTDPSRKQTVDSEISKHCAFSLPGVAYTLGRENWHCLKDVYQTLASDVQWKVRRTIASSIHEMAKILGEELTATELVPIFNGFLKDLDDVRIGVLRHLADFLKLLKPDIRKIYLYQLTDFLSVDNTRNWRFRFELAKQLCCLVELYDADDVVKYICPISMRLAADRIVAVQEEAARLISTLLAKLYEFSSHDYFDMFAEEIISKIASSTKWKERSLFCKMCNVVLHDISLPFGIFLRYFSEPLVKLSSDNIVNVRIVAAKTVSYAVNTFCDEGEGEDLCSALEKLQNDNDRDVRFFSKT